MPATLRAAALATHKARESRMMQPMKVERTESVYPFAAGSG